MDVFAGDFTFESNGTVWVTYDDAIGEEIAGEVGLIVPRLLWWFRRIVLRSRGYAHWVDLDFHLE